MPTISIRSLLAGVLPAIAIILIQALACLFFVADALREESSAAPNGSGNTLEATVSLALLAGIALGAAYLFGLVREIRARATAVAIARGALSRIIGDRFSDWGLSTAESDVALFALKGCTIGEIANMRSAAPGTVRAQLSQVYAKAGVSSQPMLMSVFLEELMSDEIPRPSHTL